MSRGIVAGWRGVGTPSPDTQPRAIARGVWGGGPDPSIDNSNNRQVIRLPGDLATAPFSQIDRPLREVVARVDRRDLHVGLDDVADHEGAGVLPDLAEEVFLLLAAQ